MKLICDLIGHNPERKYQWKRIRHYYRCRFCGGLKFKLKPKEIRMSHHKSTLVFDLRGGSGSIEVKDKAE